MINRVGGKRPLEPHKLEPDEVRQILLEALRRGNSDPFNDPLLNLIGPRDSRFAEARRTGGHRATGPIVDEWRQGNPQFDALLAEIVHELFISGLIRWKHRDRPWHEFSLTNLGEQESAESAVDVDGIADDLVEVWAEAFASYRAGRLKSAAIVIGVAAEMAIDRLAARLERAGRKDKHLAATNVAKVRREACGEALKNEGWCTDVGINRKSASAGLDALEVMGMLYARVRNEQAHPRDVHTPERPLIYGELQAFPMYARSIESIAGGAD